MTIRVCTDCHDFIENGRFDCTLSFEEAKEIHSKMIDNFPIKHYRMEVVIGKSPILSDLVCDTCKTHSPGQRFEILAMRIH